MKRLFSFLVLTVAGLCLAISPAFAQRGGGGGGGGGGSRGTTMPRDPMSGTKQDRTQKQQRQREPTVADQLAARPSLAAKLQAELPPSTNLQSAARGFDDLGRFVSAVHVAHNLGIPFRDLKAKTTGRSAISLGKAVQQLKPGMDAKAEIKKAEKQAKQDIKDSKKG